MRPFLSPLTESQLAFVQCLFRRACLPNLTVSPVLAEAPAITQAQGNHNQMGTVTEHVLLPLPPRLGALPIIPYVPCGPCACVTIRAADLHISSTLSHIHTFSVHTE